MTALLLGIGGASALAAQNIEGVWSFNGGRVAIQAQADGTFSGTVVAPTKFAQCPHPIGEQMWTDISQQADGSYWGLHQWYFESETCAPNPTPGPTVWRVLAAPNNARFLRVCFSSPGSSAQPIIAANGSTTNVTYGCVDSSLIAPLTTLNNTHSFAKAVSLPSIKKCLSHRAFKIHLSDPRNDPLKEVVIKIRGRKITTVRRHANVIIATISLRGLPKGTFTLKIRATTVLGHHLSGSRTYHTCVSKTRHTVKAKKNGRAATADAEATALT